MHAIVILGAFVAVIAKPLEVIAVVLWAYGFKLALDVHAMSGSALLAGIALPLWWGVNGAIIHRLIQSRLASWLIAHKETFGNAHLSGIFLGWVGMMAPVVADIELTHTMRENDYLALAVGYGSMFVLSLGYQGVQALAHRRKPPASDLAAEQ